MAVTITSAVSGRNSSGDLTLSSVVVASGDNCIVVLTSVQDSNHANYPVVSVTRDSQSFTKIQHYEPAGNVRVEGWYLKSPNVNTSNTVIDVTGSVGEFTACAFVLAGTDTATQPDTYNGGSGSGFAPDVSVTTTVADEMLLMVLCAETDITAVDAGQTIQVDFQDQGYENAMYSYKATTTATSYTMGNSMSSGQPYAQIVVAVKASAGASTSVKDIIGNGLIPFAR